MHLFSVGASVLVLVIASASAAQDRAALSFSKWQRRLPSPTFTVTVDWPTGNQAWVARLVERTRGQPDKTRWTDSDSCPSMMPAFARLQQIEPFKIVPPGVRGGASELMIDGNHYQVHAHGFWPQADQNGEIELSSNGGPVADWVEDALKVLAPCWRDQPPGSRQGR